MDVEIQSENIACSARLEGAERVNRPLGLNPNLLFENAPLAMFVIDSNAQVQAWNRLAEELCGMQCPFHHDGFDVDQLLPDMSLSLNQLVEDISDDAPVSSREWTSEVKGTKRDYKLLLSKVQDKSPHSQMFLLVVEDVTEDRSNARELREGNDQLSKKADKKTAEAKRARDELESFCFSVAHDLRTPLRAIDGFGFALQNDYRSVLDSQAHEYVDRIRAAGKRIDMLIDALLGLTRLTRTELYLTNVDLSALANTVVADLRNRYEGVEFSFSIQPDMEVVGDPRLLRLILENLFDNAVKFSKSKGQPEIQFYSTNEDGQLAFCVKDNGIGFDMNYASRLFRPFETLHTPGKFEGQGVGLAVVSRIVSRHGGKVWVESKEGEGTTFCFSLPSSH